jgi:hypothetical protein
MPNGQGEKPFMITKEQIIARLWELASLPPERTNGNFEGQISACKDLYEKVRYESAIQRLNEIANLDPSVSGGRQADQKAAAEALRKIVGSVKVGERGIQ